MATLPQVDIPTPYKHFPLTSGYHERSEPMGELGQHFQVQCLPMGQVVIASGRLAIGDPLLGMSASNAWIAVAPGAYSVIQTRLVCMDKGGLDIPAYLSLVLETADINARRAQQVEADRLGADPWLGENELSLLVLDDEGRWQERENIDPEQEVALLSSQSGVVAMVDEVAFGQRMPNPMTLPGGWYERFFDPYASDSWVRQMDDPAHLGAGAANLSLPGGPDDWLDEKAPTIALAQRVAPGECLVFFEYATAMPGRRTAPCAVHVELGVMLAMQQATP